MRIGIRFYPSITVPVELLLEQSLTSTSKFGHAGVQEYCELQLVLSPRLYAYMILPKRL